MSWQLSCKQAHSKCLASCAIICVGDNLVGKISKIKAVKDPLNVQMPPLVWIQGAAVLFMPLKII